MDMKRMLSDTLTIDRIVITTLKGKENAVPLKGNTSRILLDFHSHDLQGEESVKHAVIEACAKLLKSDNQSRVEMYTLMFQTLLILKRHLPS